MPTYHTIYGRCWLYSHFNDPENQEEYELEFQLDYEWPGDDEATGFRCFPTNWNVFIKADRDQWVRIPALDDYFDKAFVEGHIDAMAAQAAYDRSE